MKALKLSGKKGNDDPDVSSAVSHLKQLKAKLAELTGVEEIVGGREKKKKRTEEGKTSTIVDEQRDEERDETGDARRDQRRFQGVVFPSRRRSGN